MKKCQGCWWSGTLMVHSASLAHLEPNWTIRPGKIPLVFWMKRRVHKTTYWKSYRESGSILLRASTPRTKQVRVSPQIEESEYVAILVLLRPGQQPAYSGWWRWMRGKRSSPRALELLCFCWSPGRRLPRVTRGQN